MPVTVLYLVRHAQPQGGEEAENHGLSPVGEQQARALGKRLGSVPVGGICHGPARRAAQTAALLGESLPRAAIQPSERLRDRTPTPTTDQAALLSERRMSWFGEVPYEERDEDGAGISATISHFAAVDTQDRHEVLVTHSFVIAWLVVVRCRRLGRDG